MKKNEFERFILINTKTEFEDADIYALYKKEIACFWTVEEIDLNDDLACWDNSFNEEKHFISHVLAFFASLDQIVMENVSVNFSEEIVILRFVAILPFRTQSNPFTARRTLHDLH